MIFVTTDKIEGKEITEVLGLVKGSTVQTKHLGRDIGAAFKNLVGGELKGYNEMLEKAREISLEKMEKEAKKLGADAIVGLRLQSSAVMQSASEMIAYGTAVKIK